MEQFKKMPDFLKINNEIQARLIKESGLNPLDWVDKYAENFSKIIRQEDIFEKINTSQPGVIDLIKNRLYKNFK